VIVSPPVGALQFKATARGTAAPLRATVVELPVEELLAIVNFPVSEPVAVGANCRLNVAVWPAFRVNGNVAPVTVNPVPEAVAELTVTAAEPVDDKVSDCVACVPTATLPKAMLVELMESVGVDPPPPVLLVGERLSANVFVTPFSLELSVTVATEVTAVTVAVN
jgi:hypothetical protein